MAEWEDVAAGHEARLGAVLARAMRAAAKRYEAEDTLALPDGFRDEVTAALTALWRQAGRGAAEATVEAIGDAMAGKADEEPLWQRVVQSFIEQYGAAKVTRIVEATRDQLLRIVQAGQREGLGVPEIAKQMRAAVPELARLRSEVIARTEAHTSSMHAGHAVAKTARRPLVKVWVSVEDGRTRDFGEGDGVVDDYSHRAMHGAEAGLDMPFMVPTRYGTREPLMFPGDPNGSAGNVINCYLPGTLVRGRFVAASRALYVGQVIEIETASGRRIAVTPNHPVMANRRFVPANSIRKGDYLVANAAQVENTTGVGDDNIDLRPARIEDVFAALVQLQKPTLRRVVGIDFHGDGRAMQGDVEVVDIKGVLVVGCDPATSQLLDDLALIESDTISGHAVGPQNLLSARMLSAADGVVCGGDQALPVAFGGLRHSVEHGGAAVSRGATSPLYGARDHAPVATQSGRNTNDWLSGKMAFEDLVVGVRKRPFCGHVYDLQEISGAMIANALVTHNCRCAVTYRRAD